MNLMDTALAIARITNDDYEIIYSYLLELRVEKGIGVLRMNKLAGLATRLRRFIGPYRTNSLEAVHQGILAINDAKFDGKPISQNTLRDYILFLKRFYRWLIKNGYYEIPLDRIQRIKTSAWDKMNVRLLFLRELIGKGTESFPVPRNRW